MKNIFKQHPHITTFGIMMLFFSAPGQTFLLSLFIHKIFTDLNISMSVFAALYSGATLSASILLNPFGRLLDRLNLKLILIGNVIMMAVGCLILGTAQNEIMIFIAFFLLRLFGQGVFLLTASTTISKSFHHNRGRALSIMSLGFPLSELIYPIITVILISHFGWRTTYILFGISTLLIMLPLEWYCIKKNKLEKGVYLEEEMSVQAQTLNLQDPIMPHDPEGISLKVALKKPVFYATLVASCVPPLIMTGIFFHQETLFKIHHWPLSLMATAIMTSAICKASGAMLIGPYIDKHKLTPPFAILIAMLGIASIIAGFGGPIDMIFVLYALMGSALGMAGTILDVVLPNLFGTKHLGSIKGFVGTFRNGLTAFGPLPLALAFDYGISIPKLMLATGVVIMSMAIIPIVSGRTNPEINTPYQE